MLAHLAPGITYGFAVAVMPGPFLAYLMSQALNHGWLRTLPLAFAPLISDGPIAVLVLLVLSQIPAGLVQAFRLIGGAFVFYLALEAGRSWYVYESQGQSRPPSQSISVLKAATVNWLNPNPYIGWSLVLGPIVLDCWRRAPSEAIALLASFYATMILSTVVILFLTAAAGTARPGLNRGLIGLSALGLASCGFYQLWLGFTV